MLSTEQVLDYMARAAQLDTEFASWRTHYQELAENFLPRAGRFLVTDRNRGAKRHHAILDNTGLRAARTCAAGLMAGATSPARPWVKIIAADAEAGRDYEVKTWLDDATTKVLHGLRRSNAYRALHQLYEELAVFGTAVAVVQPDARKVLHLHVLTAGEYRLATDAQGTPNALYRRYSRTVAEVVAEFGTEKVSDQVREDAKERKNWHKPVELLHIIEPRQLRDPSQVDDLNMPWLSCYIEVGRDGGRVLRESGYPYFPVLACRWTVTSGDTYGHGPGMEALGDTKQLQVQQLRKTQAIDLTSNPPVTASTALKSREVNRLPGGVTYHDGTAAKPVQNTLDVTTRIDYVLADNQDIRERIVASFFADLFLMLASQNLPRMTATEVAERHEEKLIQLGPMLERLHDELLEPLVRLTFRLMLEAGELPPPPPQLADVPLGVEFVSMLAQAQRAIGLVPIERALSILAPVAQGKPALLDNLDEDELWREVTEAAGTPTRITRSPRLRDQLRQAQLAAQQAAAQQQMLAGQAAIARDLGNTPSSGPNALRDVLGSLSGYGSPSPQNY